MLVAVVVLCSSTGPARSVSPHARRPPARGPVPGQGGFAGRPLDGRSINQLLVSATSAESIMRVFIDHRDRFEDVNLSTAWNRLGKQHIIPSDRRVFFHRNERTLADMNDRTDRIVHRLAPRNLAGIAHGIARVGYRAGHRTMLRIAHRALNCLADFKAQEIANLVWALSKAGLAAPDLFDAVARETRHRLHEFKPQELSNTAWAFSKAGVRAPAFFAAIAAEAIPQLALFKAQELANLVWSFATVREPAPRLFEEVAREAMPRAHEFNSQELGNFAWAFAKADHSAHALFNALAAEAVPRLHEFKAQELANTAWAFATAGVRHDELFAALARVFVTRVHLFKSQEVSNTIWAFATAGADEPELFYAAAEAVSDRMDEFRTQEIANTAWAFATAGISAPRLFTAVAHELRERQGEFNLQELTNVAWAFAKRNIATEDIYELLCDATCPMVAQLAPQGIANMAWAFATVNAPSAHRLLAAIERTLVERMSSELLHEFKAQEIANLVWACATVGSSSERLFDVLATFVPARVAGFEPQDIANTAWAFSVTQQMRPALAAALVARTIESGADAFGLEASCQLHQFNMALQLDQPFLPDRVDTVLPASPAGYRLGDTPPLELPHEMASNFLAAMVVQAPAASSQLHNDVSFALSQLGVAHVNELCVAHAGYHCDIAVLPDPALSMPRVLMASALWPRAQTAGAACRVVEVARPPSPPSPPALAAVRSVIIEVNGPWHYTLNRMPRPASVTKARHLRKLGWHVIEVPYWDWEQLNTLMGKEAYLRRELEQIDFAPAAGERRPPAATSARRLNAARTLDISGAENGRTALRARTDARSSPAALDDAARPSVQPPRGGIRTLDRSGAATRRVALRARAGARAAPAMPHDAARPQMQPPSTGAALLPTGEARVAWDGDAVGALVKRLVVEVRGISTAKGESLLARATVLAGQGRNLGALSVADWQCPGIGERLAERVQLAASGAHPTSSGSLREERDERAGK